MNLPLIKPELNQLALAKPLANRLITPDIF